MSNLFSGIESQDQPDILLQGIPDFLTPTKHFLPDLETRILALPSQDTTDQARITREIIQSLRLPRVTHPTAQQVVLSLELHTAYHLVNRPLIR